MVWQIVLASSFATILGPFTTLGAPSASAELNGLDGFTTGKEGEPRLFQPGNFHVGGAGPAAGNALLVQGLANLSGPQVNNRSFCVTGSNKTDITLTPGIVEEVILGHRCTARGFSVVPTALRSTFLNHTPLADAEDTHQVSMDLGLPLMVDRNNADNVLLTSAPGAIMLNGQTFNGSSITRISLTNISAKNSAITPGDMTVEVIPESPEPSIVPIVPIVASCLAYMVLMRLRVRRLLPGLYGSRRRVRARRFLSGLYGPQAVVRVRRQT